MARCGPVSGSLLFLGVGLIIAASVAGGVLLARARAMRCEDAVVSCPASGAPCALSTCPTASIPAGAGETGGRAVSVYSESPCRTGCDDERRRLTVDAKSALLVGCIVGSVWTALAVCCALSEGRGSVAAEPPEPAQAKDEEGLGALPPAWRAVDGPARGAGRAGDEEDCCICLEGMSLRPAAVAPCGHAFHVACLARWRAHRDACPLCQAVLGPLRCAGSMA